MASQTILRPKLTQAVPFFHVADMKRSLNFYVDGLGFQIDRRWVVDDKLRWCWLNRDDVAIMLQQFATEGHDSWKPAGSLKGEGVSICVMCADAIGLYRELKTRGIDAKRPVVGNGLWVTQLTDPDGFNLFFESPADLPEGTVFED